MVTVAAYHKAGVLCLSPSCSASRCSKHASVYSSRTIFHITSLHSNVCVCVLEQAVCLVISKEYNTLGHNLQWVHHNTLVTMFTCTPQSSCAHSFIRLPVLRATYVAAHSAPAAQVTGWSKHALALIFVFTLYFKCTFKNVVYTCFNVISCCKMIRGLDICDNMQF